MKESKASGTYHYWKPVVGISKSELWHPYCLGQNNEEKLIVGEIGTKSEYFKNTLRLSLQGRARLMDSLQRRDDTNISKQGESIVTQIVKRERKNGSETNDSRDKAARDLTLVWRQPERPNNAATISDIVDYKIPRIRENDNEILKSLNGLTNSRAPFGRHFFRMGNWHFGRQFGFEKAYF